jgi:hypothetical protein
MIVVRDAANPTESSRARMGLVIIAAAAASPLVYATLAGAQAVRRRMSKSDADDQLLTVTQAEVAALRFPVGHPRRKVVYVGHPVDPTTYVPVAYFHTFLFEHKVAEALRLMRSLGADSVDVVRVEGWNSGAGITLQAPVPGAEQVQVGASGGAQQRSGQSVMTRMRLRPSGRPQVPENLVWLPHEPLWQEVVDARLNSRLSSFVLDVRSYDDYGVNANLQVKVSRAGLEAGGSFVKHQATLWRLEGTFIDY